MSVFVDRDVHESVVLPIWETRAEAEGASQEPQWQSYSERVDEVLAGPINVHVFELTGSAPVYGFPA